jgi:hypothetical protein
MLELFFALLIEFSQYRTPHIVCYQIGDNQYTCDAYWTDP